jgi:uncharacterized protein YggU (UPF0235/DUF167 family)
MGKNKIQQNQKSDQLKNPESFSQNEKSWIFPNEKKNDYYTIKVLVKPSAKDQKIYEQDGILCVDLLNPPQNGKANAELQKLFRKKLRIPQNAISIINGLISHNKLIEVYICNTNADETKEKLLK